MMNLVKYLNRHEVLRVILLTVGSFIGFRLFVRLVIMNLFN